MSTSTTPGTKRILAVSSGGGHWVQLKRLMPAFEGQQLSVVTINEAYRSESPTERFYVVNDATRWSKLSLVMVTLRVLLILLRVRPHVVISTGAAPGFAAVRLGKWLGARTIWVDSIANAERLSLSGRKAGRFVDVWLTQWPHLAGAGGPRYEGSVL